MALDEIGLMNFDLMRQEAVAGNLWDEKYKTAKYSVPVCEELMHKSDPGNTAFIKPDINEEKSDGDVMFKHNFIFHDAKVEVPSLNDNYQAAYTNMQTDKKANIRVELPYESSDKCDISQTATVKGLLSSGPKASSIDYKDDIKLKMENGIKEEMPGTLYVESYTCYKTENEEIEYRPRTSGRTETISMEMETSESEALEMACKHEVVQTVKAMKGDNKIMSESIKCGEKLAGHKEIVQHGLSHPREKSPARSICHPGEEPHLNRMLHTGEKPPTHSMRQQEATQYHHIPGVLHHPAETRLTLPVDTCHRSGKAGSNLEAQCSNEIQLVSIGAITPTNVTKMPEMKLMQHVNKTTCPSSSLQSPSAVNKTSLIADCGNADKQMTLEGNGNVINEKRSANVCDICGRTLSSRLTSTQNYLIYAGKKQYLYERCDRRFSPRHPKQNQTTHTGEKPYDCEICGKRFKSHSDLKSHVMRPADDTVPTCRGQNATRKRKYGKVSKDKTAKGEKSDCPTDETLPAYSTLTNEGNLMCDICGKSFSDRCDFTEHERDKCIPVKNKRFVCEFCGHRFSQRRHMVEHRRTHTGEKPFVCETCGKTFRQDSALHSHKRLHHGDKLVRESFICDVCGRKLKTLSGLKVHSSLHTAEKLYLCDICGKVFDQNIKLVKHLKTHDPAKLFECTECGKMYKTSDSLRGHKVLDKQEKPFSCELCDKTFFFKNPLTVHRRSHTGERPHACKTCGKRFTQTGKLREHERIHTGEKPHVCDTCGKAFRGRSDLTVHIRIHTGEKPYVCGLCGAAFTVSAGLRQHRAKKHPSNISGKQ